MTQSCTCFVCVWVCVPSLSSCQWYPEFLASFFLWSNTKKSVLPCQPIKALDSNPHPIILFGCPSLLALREASNIFNKCQECPDDKLLIHFKCIWVQIIADIVSRVYRKCRFYIQQVSLKNASASGEVNRVWNSWNGWMFVFYSSTQGRILKNIYILACPWFWFVLPLFFFKSLFYTKIWNSHEWHCPDVFIYRMVCCPLCQVIIQQVLFLLNGV